MTSTLDIAKEVSKLLIARGWTLALAESCTGAIKWWCDDDEIKHMEK